jgi:peptide/nickel transport system permease protein
MYRRLPVTLELTALSIALATLLGLPAGLIAGSRKNSIVDFSVSTVGLTGLSIPNFWLGTMLVLFFAVRRQILPPSGFVRLSDSLSDNLRHLILPVIALAVVSASVIMRVTRTSTIEVLQRDYVRTAQAKGAPKRDITIRHVLKNALIPVITVIGMEAGYIFGGAFLVEAVFLIPGIATWSLYAITQRDYPVLQATTMVVVIIFMTINLIIDILYTYLDPRLRLGDM